MSITSISLVLSLLGAAVAAPTTGGPTAPRTPATTPAPSTGIATTPAPAPTPATAPATESPAAGGPPAPSPATLQPPSAHAAATGAADTHGATWPPVGGFAFELGTGGLSGTIGGAIGLGWGSRAFQGGVAFDVTHADLSEEAGGDNLGHLRTTALAVGLWLRWAMSHTHDGRVDAIGAMDFQYTRMSVDDRNGNTGIGSGGTADGVVLRAGPGLRLWATPWLALSYTAQLSLADLTGALVALPGSSGSMPGLLTSRFEDVQIALVGRLSILALF